MKYFIYKGPPYAKISQKVFFFGGVATYPVDISVSLLPDVMKYLFCSSAAAAAAASVGRRTVHKVAESMEADG